MHHATMTPQRNPPELVPQDLGWASRDEETASLRQQVYDLKALLAQASRDLERLAAANDVLRAENLRLTALVALPRVEWLPPRPGVVR